MSKYLPDLSYLPDNLTSVTPKTFIGRSVPLSVFLKKVTLEHIPNLEDRKQLCRNYAPQAHIFNLIKDNTSKFSDCRLVVAEGLYKPSETQKLAVGGDLWLQSKGRQVVYHVYKDGKRSIEQTSLIAEYIGWVSKFYDEVCITGDNINPDGSLHLEIVVTMPEIPSDYNVRFERKVSSAYNGIKYENDIVDFGKPITPSSTQVSDSTQTVSGLVTLGDIHAKNLAANGGAGWLTYAKGGRTSSSTIILENLKKIKSGSTVFLSVGMNDLLSKTNISNETIVENIKNIIQTSLGYGHSFVYMLPPIGGNVNETTLKDFRSKVVEMINSDFNKVSIEDLDKYSLVLGENVLNEQSYVDIARKYV